MTSPSPASVEPITVADREKLVKMMAQCFRLGPSTPSPLSLDESRAYEARVVELEAALTQSQSFHADAEAWGRDLEARLVSDHVTSEARATALLEAHDFWKEKALAVYRSNPALFPGVKQMFEQELAARAAINAGASNDRK